MIVPEPERGLSPRQSRIVGALLALHAGDSLGATCEFQTHAQIASKYPGGLRDIIGGGPFSWSAGHATDDTDMTRGVLLAYREYKEGDDIARLAGDKFIDWQHGRWPDRNPGTSPADIGGATAEGLNRYFQTRDPERAGAGIGSAGNGSLMRCIPTGLFEPDSDKRIRDSIRISKITHDDPRCTIACAVYNEIVAELIAGQAPNDAVKAGERVAIGLENGRDGEVYRSLRLGRTLQITQMALHGPPAELKGKCSGYVLESLSVAVAAVLDSTRSLEDILVDVVRIGRDTDTNTCIAGGLLGARDGVESVPERWRSRLQFGDEFREIALQLAKN